MLCQPYHMGVNYKGLTTGNAYLSYELPEYSSLAMCFELQNGVLGRASQL